MNEYAANTQIYQEKVRVRACGLLVEDGKLLMIRHRGLGLKGFLWAPPGGGVDFHESAEKTVIKEFLEETGLEVAIKDFLFVNQYMDDRHHAVELFFHVEKTGGTLSLGADPEVPSDKQILEELKWFTFAELDAMDVNVIHNIFGTSEPSKNVLDWRGLFNFVNISG